MFARAVAVKDKSDLGIYLTYADHLRFRQKRVVARHLRVAQSERAQDVALHLLAVPPPRARRRRRHGRDLEPGMVGQQPDVMCGLHAGLIRGVRPNSPAHTTVVRSSRPRSFSSMVCRSKSRLANTASSAA